jgi:hypothetical protein
LYNGKPVARRGRKARDLSKTARLPAQECKVLSIRKGARCEGETGTFDLGPDAPRGDGADHRRWDAVGLAMKVYVRGQSFRLILALLTLASSALVIEAGQRWH